jgi:modified peptide precursor CbpA
LLRTIREPEDLLDVTNEGRNPMERISDKSCAWPAFLIAHRSNAVNTNPESRTEAQPRPAIIAIRKTCDAEGTGLSHYVLMDKQAKLDKRVNQ